MIADGAKAHSFYIRHKTSLYILVKSACFPGSPVANLRSRMPRMCLYGGQIPVKELAVLKLQLPTNSSRRWQGNAAACRKNLHSTGTTKNQASQQSHQPFSVLDNSDLGKLIVEGAKFTTIAHQVWRRVVRPGDLAVDATCGNGHDTLAMARLAIGWREDCGAMVGSVLAIDKQALAVASTESLLRQSLFPAEVERVQLECACHSQLRRLVSPASARLVAFNLGYLPGGRKEVITQQSTTLAALEASADILAPGGLISVVTYVGHPEAWEEHETVRQFAASLPPQEWDCVLKERLNRPLSPRLLLLHKKLRLKNGTSQS